MGAKRKVSLFIILFAMILSVLASLCLVHAVEVTATISINASGPIVYDSSRGEIWVTHTQNGRSNNPSNFITVISDSTNEVVATVPLSYNGYAMAYDWGKGEIFVVTANSSVLVISESTETWLQPFQLECLLWRA